MRRPGRVDDAVQQQQSRALLVIAGNEGHHRAAVAGSAHGRFNQQGTPGTLRARRHIERVQSMRVGGTATRRFHRHRHHVQRAGNRIDHGRPGDADLGRDLAAVERVLERHSSHTGRGVKKIHLPKRRGVRPGIAVGVESVHAVVFGGHVDDVVSAFTGNGDSGQKQRLCVNVSIHPIGKELTKLL